MKRRAMLMAATVLAAIGTAPMVAAQEEPARKACVKHLRKVGGPDAKNGITVLNTDYSEAGTLVRMRDAGGSVWECIGYRDGSIGDFKVVDAMDDGGGAMAGAAAGKTHHAAPTTQTQQVRFDTGATGATYEATLTPGSSLRYVLGARDGQFLTVRLHKHGKDVSYQIFNPDQTFLLDMVPAGQKYRGQLWQSGDHVVEVINRGQKAESFKVTFQID